MIQNEVEEYYYPLMVKNFKYILAIHGVINNQVKTGDGGRAKSFTKKSFHSRCPHSKK